MALGIHYHKEVSVMSDNKGKNVGLMVVIIIVLLIVLIRFNPFILAPFGALSGVFHAIRDVINDGVCMLKGRFWGFPFSSFFSLIFLVIWIAVIMWVYRDAERRRMNGLLWALLVFIGNLIGLIIYLIVRNDYVTDQQEEKEDLATSTCPKCNKPIKPDFAYCPHCTAPLKGVCHKCNRDVEPEWMVCPHCGNNLK